jgi:hypothetical protein
MDAVHEYQVAARGQTQEREQFRTALLRLLETKNMQMQAAIQDLQALLQKQDQPSNEVLPKNWWELLLRQEITRANALRVQASHEGLVANQIEALDLMSFGAEPTNLLIDGPFTGNGLASLRGLDGVFGLSFFWHTSRLQGDDLCFLDGLSNLGYLGCQDELCNDEAMQHIGAHPQLRMLMGQGTVATDEGFRRLRRSQTIEYFWGRECPNLKGPGFAALAGMRALKGLAVSCKFVDDAALAKLPDFPSLKELMPMDVSDDGFRHIGRCEQLESLILMYCRETGDVATSHIAGLSNLKKYHAGNTLITDRSLEMLGRMNSLEEISFEGCKFISDAGINFLTTLPRLREISIGGCPKVTRTGVTGFASSVGVNYDTL